MTQKPTPDFFLYTSNWRGKPTFKALPVREDAPFIELIYDTFDKVLYVVLKLSNRTLQFLPKIDKYGDLIEMKSPRKFRNVESRAAEERVEISRYTEFTIEKREEIEVFLKRFCENEENFREVYFKFLDAPADNDTPVKIEMSPEQQMEKLNELVAGAKEHGAELKIVKEEQ